MIYGHQANGSFVAHCPYWRNRPGADPQIPFR